jgi:monoterpene epsilon-lactone hydrolase
MKASSNALSFRSRLLRVAVRRLIAPIVSGDAPVPVRRRKLERLARMMRTPLPAGTQIETMQLGGVPGNWVRNTRVAAKRTVLYFHGGAYVAGSPTIYRDFLAQLARSWQAQVAAVDYRLAPEHPYPAAVSDVLAAYRALLEQGIASTEIVVAGDSAGGGLVLACLLQARDAGLSLPAAAVLLSPWVDLAVRGSSAERGRDDMLDADRLRADAALYLAGAAPETPLASPLYADLHGLPPLLVQVTDTEILLDDARRLVDALHAAGIAAELRVWAGLWHVWQVGAGKMPEADGALREAAAFLDGAAPAHFARP